MKRTDILSIIMRTILTIFINVVGFVALVLLFSIKFHINFLLIFAPPIIIAIFGDIAIWSKNEKLKVSFYTAFVIFFFWGLSLLLMFPD
ncbi:MAG: hypothetical protein K6A44_07830 [bacterium]|nr:hypothetical protein [bacterium]